MAAYPTRRVALAAAVALPLAASSPEAAAEAAAAIEAWLKDGPAEEKQTVFGMYRVSPADITSRLSNFK